MLVLRAIYTSILGSGESTSMLVLRASCSSVYILWSEKSYVGVESYVSQGFGESISMLVLRATSILEV